MKLLWRIFGTEHVPRHAGLRILAVAALAVAGVATAGAVLTSFSAPLAWVAAIAGGAYAGKQIGVVVLLARDGLQLRRVEAEMRSGRVTMHAVIRRTPAEAAQLLRLMGAVPDDDRLN